VLCYGRTCRTCRAGQFTGRPRVDLQRDWGERQRRARAVRQWREVYGDWCPGWRRTPHAVVAPNVLTADHVLPVGVGGDPRGPLGILCRSCNGRKSATVDPPAGPSRQW